MERISRWEGWQGVCVCLCWRVFVHNLFVSPSLSLYPSPSCHRLREEWWEPVHLSVCVCVCVCVWESVCKCECVSVRLCAEVAVLPAPARSVHKIFIALIRHIPLEPGSQRARGKHWEGLHLSHTSKTGTHTHTHTASDLSVHRRRNRMYNVMLLASTS